MNCLFVIVSAINDVPVFEIDLFKPEVAKRIDQQRNFRELFLHSSLDVVEAHLKTSNTYYLKMIDKYNEFLLSAYVTPSNERFLLLHDVRNDEAIRVFFLEAYEVYLKCTLNPFYRKGAALKTFSSSTLYTQLDLKIRQLARKHFDK